MATMLSSVLAKTACRGFSRSIINSRAFVTSSVPTWSSNGALGSRQRNFFPHPNSNIFSGLYQSLPSWLTNGVYQATRCMGNGKQKTHKGIAKRFKVKANGKLIRGHSGARHNTGYKKRVRCNRLAMSVEVTDKTMAAKYKKLMGQG